MNNILKYWLLCESVKFDKIKINKDLILFDRLNIQRTEITKHSFKMVYHSLIKVKDLIQIIYEVYNIRDIDFEELENISDDEYTYLACSYFDNRNGLFANTKLSNISIFINPIFYYLNNFETKDKTYQEYMEIFNNSYAPVKPIVFRYVPDTSSLVEYARKYANASNIFEKLFPSDSVVYIAPCTLKELISKRVDGKSDFFLYRRILDDLTTAIQRSDETKIVFEFPVRGGGNDYTNVSFESIKNNITYNELTEDIYTFTLNLSNKFENDYVYLFTSKYKLEEFVSILKSKRINETYKKLKSLLDSNNTFLTDFINNVSISSNITLPYGKESINSIKKTLLSYLKLETYQDLFQKEIYGKNITLSTKDLDSLGFHFTHYLDSLTEEPKYNGIKYLQKNNSFTDVQIDFEYQTNINKISSFPMARWFSPYSLYYSQQNIVNQFFDSYGRNEIVSANGAAGTGKTTLVKDIVAEIMFKKASKIIEFDFNVISNNAVSNEFLGEYEIFVVSNNNFAVENISKELPKMDSSCFSYLGLTNDFLFLQEISNNLVKDSFGLVSAALGNSDNVSKVLSFLVKLEETIKNLTIDIPYVKYEIINDFNYSLEKVNYYRALFSDIDSFHLKLEDGLLDLKAKRYKHYLNIRENINNYRTLLVNKKDLDSKIFELNKSLKENYVLLLELSSSDAECNKIINNTKIDLDAYRYKENSLSNSITTLQIMLNNMSFLKKLFKYKFVKQIKINIDNAKSQVELMKALFKNSLDSNDTYKNITILNRESSLIRNEIAAYKIDHSESKSIVLPTMDFLTLDDKTIQLSSFYALSGFKKAQASLFVNSLRIHELNLIINFQKLKSLYLNNFNGLNLTNGSYLSAMSFIFPVLSSSLASTPKMLKSINKVGTIICDESGQASVLSGYCFMNKTLNALTVGDPLQIEPISEIFKPLNNALLKSNDIVDDIFDVEKSSVQVLSDYASSNGTVYSSNRIGMPLKVHRRCVAPIFDISNDISYDNQIFNVTPALKQTDILFSLSESSWYNIKTTNDSFRGNISLNEKALVDKFIMQNKLCEYDENEKPSIYVISPFKDKYGVYSNNNGIEYDFGTLHTFQGKEADIVFFVLGGNSNGARSWVAQKANMLNVAATRAKKRFYVVGDYNAWCNLSYFDRITKHLGEHTDMVPHLDKILKDKNKR